jgi:hypothetical protein
VADGFGEFRENIENSWIVVLHLTCAVIAEEMIELRFRLGKKVVAMAIDDINALTGMRVIEAQVMIQRRSGLNGEARSVEEESCHQAAKTGQGTDDGMFAQAQFSFLT